MGEEEISLPGSPATSSRNPEMQQEPEAGTKGTRPLVARERRNEHSSGSAGVGEKKSSGNKVQRQHGAPSAPSSSRFEYRRFRNRGRAAAKKLNVDVNERNTISQNGAASVNEEKENTNQTIPKKVESHKRRVCKYFATEKSCYFGDRCRFIHVKENEICKDDLRPITERSQEKKPHTFVPPPRFAVITQEKEGSEIQQKAYESEIAYFRRRFRDAKVSANDKGTDVTFVYGITDPEWIFDVKALTWSLFLPLGYPLRLANLRLQGQSLPSVLVIHIEKAANEFLSAKFANSEAKNAYECVGKTLLRWIDRSIFDLFVNGLKKTKLVVEAENAGISLVTPATVPVTEPLSSDMGEGSSEIQQRKVAVENETAPSKSVANSGELDETEESTENLVPIDSSGLKAASAPASIKVCVQWNNISGNIASISAVSLDLNVKCVRCNATAFNLITCTSKQPTFSHCKKCQNRQSVRMESELVHEHSNVIARLEPKGCRPVDCVLLSSKLRFVCLSCNREADAENLTYGIAHKSWCFSCHAKSEFEISAIRFTGNLQNIAKEDESMQKAKAPKKKRDEKSIEIVEGKPLPDCGTCRHYKKSFRWFRFPCCGKVYPCDLCHSEIETEHEMKLANRMVCGFCGKEQPFQNAKPCINCNSNMTRVKSSHWEGGKGCRDQRIMSRNDDRKYANSRMKTVSKKRAGQLAVKKSEKESSG